MGAEAFEEWSESERQLAQAEIDVLRWELREATPVPSELRARVAGLRDRVAFLFEVASAHLASPDGSAWADT